MKPILFNTEMVKAIQNGTKTATTEIKSRYQVGDILYVRETWFYEGAWHELTAGKPDLPSGRYLHRYVYKAESPDYPVNVGVGAEGWHPSIHMPKEAARIFLRVTDIRVERLQDISDMDLTQDFDLDVALEAWGKEESCRMVWNRTVKKSDLDKYGWDANPWVTVNKFEKISKEEAYGA